MTQLAAPSPRLSRTRRTVPHVHGFWIVGVVFASAMAFSTAPAPLYAFYRQRDGFSTFMITVIYAVYGIGVIGSLFLAGHTSDWLGRRRLVGAALTAEIVAAALFLAWPQLPGLILARIATGIGIGLITATATAHMGELHALGRPGTGRARADRVSVLANLGGLALGPLITGFLARYVTHPLTVPYIIFLAVLMFATIAVAAVPETVEPTAERTKYRPQRISVPAQGRPLYYTAAIAAFAAFAILGLFSSVSPGFIAGTLHHTSPLLAGTVTFLVFGGAATAQVASSVLTAARQLQAGLLLMAVGVLIITSAVWWPSLVLFIIGGVIAGSGAGILFKGALATAAGLALPQSRGEALAGLFLVAFVGLVLPALGIGIATLSFSLRDALLGFALIVLLLIGGISIRLRMAQNPAQEKPRLILSA